MHIIGALLFFSHAVIESKGPCFKTLGMDAGRHWGISDCMGRLLGRVAALLEYPWAPSAKWNAAMKGSAMRELNDDAVIYAFASNLRPVMTVPSGETVRIRTKDCFGNQLAGPEDELDEIDWDAINPATGPIFVEGAVPGGALKVDIRSIEFDGHAACCTGKDEGVYGDKLDGWSTRFCQIEGDELIWSEGVRIPLRPMIGVIGVAPEGDPVNCGTPGSHGGNMDNTAVTAGATLYFPVATPGALFGLGDMHAVMGDGEVSVSGAEAPGWATVTLTALPELSLADPLIEDAQSFGVIASADSLDAAADRAVHEMVDLMVAHADISAPDAVMLLSLVGDVQVCQMVDPQKTVRFMVPKRTLRDIGFRWPFGA